ncbi:CsbD family protein [Levilactobacillus fujinensis]|uniref:CsbD family protein n=1 Tax=Levilactobacillus fujinensis TaxID=2486024 RepID=A0ABW1TH62_9LACO|nr:CsbD family protein [Levilactobacillus fujinensis]
MKNLLLGVSLAANVALGYLLLQDKEQLQALRAHADSAADKMVGKVEQLKGSVTDDPVERLKGKFHEGRGEVKDAIEDVREDLAE